ncbi:MAG TPA: MoaD/ThiS family protein [Rhizomicrobium sp.]|nr:MoaD/ThiS family protein [Rhizomicrobium sp.]
MIRLLFLGKFSELAPARLGEIALPDGVQTLSDLKDWIARTEPVLGRAMDNTVTRLVLNQDVAQDLSRRVSDGDEIAFLPPMSGG